eukprot:scaffold196669_cov28-Tisochrysis_lutea.AAC.4
MRFRERSQLCTRTPETSSWPTAAAPTHPSCNPLSCATRPLASSVCFAGAGFARCEPCSLWKAMHPSVQETGIFAWYDRQVRSERPLTSSLPLTPKRSSPSAAGVLRPAPPTSRAFRRLAPKSQSLKSPAAAS